MNKLKTIFLSLSLILSFGAPLAVAGSAVAVDVVPLCNSSAKGTDVCKEVKSQQSTGKNPFIKFIKVAINVVSLLVGLFAVIGVLISSIKFITASGDAQAVASARTTLTYALIGVAVTVLAQSIVLFVLNKV